ncbi:MAG: tRNA pseudouridine(55) synthase TruB [Alphaproteobacteria bacterium]|nr:tRNA pseudouridine(55) synthase TruB [Alphaproteobacteria bacterium]
MARRKKGQKIDGWINLDKPLGLTSTQAMAKVRRILDAQKAGHAGTLDPLASGILPIALGEATKTIPFAQDHLKTYEFTVTWGEQRDTDDSEGEIIARSDERPTQDAIIAALPAFIGDIEQIPPKFSAIKIDGQRAYDLARDGEAFEIKPREVYIESLDLLATRENEVDLTMTCGKGTYVRALARDLAHALGTYGYISALKRTAVGPFAIKNAISLEKLEEMGINAPQALLPLETALDDIPALAIKEGETADLRNGRFLSFVSRADFARLEQSGIEQHDEALALYNGQPVALVEIEGPKIKPVRVFNI